MNYSPSLAREVRAEMARQGIQVKQLAELTGIPVSRLHRRLSTQPPTPGGNGRHFNTDELARVADALGTSAAELLGRAA